MPGSTTIVYVPVLVSRGICTPRPAAVIVPVAICVFSGENTLIVAVVNVVLVTPIESRSPVVPSNSCRLMRLAVPIVTVAGVPSVATRPLFRMLVAE